MCRPPIQLLCIFESYKSWPVEAKRKTRLCSRWRSSVCGYKFSSPESLEQVAFCTYIELYRYPWLPVSPANFLCCRRHQYNLSIYHTTKSAHSSCDATDSFIITETSTCCTSHAKGYQALSILNVRCRCAGGRALE